MARPNTILSLNRWFLKAVLGVALTTTIVFSQGTVRWTGATSTAWETATNWTVVSGTPSRPPGSGDDVQIGTGAITRQPTLTTPTIIKSLTYGTTAASTLTVNGNLTVTGAITNTVNVARVHNINLSAGVTLECASANLSTAANGANMTITCNGGTFNCTGDLTVQPTTQTTVITFAVGTGTFNVGGTTLAGAVSGQNRGCAITVSTGTIGFAGPFTMNGGNSTFTSSGAASISFGGNVTKTRGTFNLTNSTTTFTGSGSVTPTTAMTFGDVVINAGVTTSTVNAGGTLTIAGDLNVSGTATLAGTEPVLLTGVNATIDGQGTISASITVSQPHTILATADLTITGALTMSTASGDITNNGVVTATSINGTVGGATWTQNSATSVLNYLSTTQALLATGTLVATVPGNTVNYAGAGPQTVKATTYSNLTLSGSGLKTTTGITVTGSISIEGSATVSAAPTYNVNSILEYHGSGPETTGAEFPSPMAGMVRINNPNGVTLNGVRTINNHLRLIAGSLNDGGFQITGNAADSLTLEAGTSLILGSAGTGSAFPTNYLVRLDPASTVTYNSNAAQNIAGGPSVVYGNLTLNATGAVTKTATAALDVEGNFVVGANNTFAASTFSHTLKGNLTNNGTFNANSSIVTLSGASAQTISGSSSTTFNNLTVNNSAGVINSASSTVNGTLTLTAGTLTLSSGLTMGNGATIVRSDGTISAVPTFTTSVNLLYTNTNPITTGPELPTATTILNNLTINNTNTVTLAASPQVNGTLLFSAGTMNASTFDITMAGPSWTNNGAVFNPGTGTVTFTRGTAQTIGGNSANQTFNNLTINGAGGVTVGGFTATLNVNNALTLTTGSLTTGTATAININGNWVNNSAANAFAPGTSTVTFGATSSQSIGGSFGTTFDNMTISNAADTLAANHKTAGNTLAIGGILTISSGNVLDMSTFSASSFGAGSVNNGKIMWAASNYYVGGTGTTEFYGSAASTVAQGPDYGNILITGNGSMTIAGAVGAHGGDATTGVLVKTNLTINNTGSLTITGMDLNNDGGVINSNGPVTVQ